MKIKSSGSILFYCYYCATLTVGLFGQPIVGAGVEGISQSFGLDP